MKLSEDMKMLISKAKEEAFALNIPYISTFHFFIADCRLNNKYSLRNFAFEDLEKFNAFLETLQKAENGKVVFDSIPLTKEAESTLMLGAHIQKVLGDAYFEPHHFFLAAAKNRNSIFFSMFSGTKQLFRKIQNYYIGLNELKLANNIWRRIALEIKFITLCKL